MKQIGIFFFLLVVDPQKIQTLNEDPWALSVLVPSPLILREDLLESEGNGAQTQRVQEGMQGSSPSTFPFRKTSSSPTLEWRSRHHAFKDSPPTTTTCTHALCPCFSPCDHQILNSPAVSCLLYINISITAPPRDKSSILMKEEV